jgi:hypothetical protein
MKGGFVRSRINWQIVKQILIVAGIVGVLVVGYGIFSIFDTSQKYNDLALIPPPIDLQNASDADKITFAQIELAKRDLLRRREEAKAVIGMGATLLGITVLLAMRMPETPKTQQVITSPSDQT